MDGASRPVNDVGMRLCLFPFVLLILLLVGCAKEPPSLIVQKVEAAGAGDLRSATQPAIEDWFRKHSEFAIEIRDQCRPLREKAPATWSSSTEGRVCNAANVASVFNFKDRKGDGKGYEAGK
jgi:hypothetical protein